MGIPTGTQIITQRLSPCLCGCKGTDPWHARRIKRVVRNVVKVEPDMTERFVTLARGEYKHQSGTRVCVFKQVQFDGELQGMGWWQYEDAR
jgi:hypothetical protein